MSEAEVLEPPAAPDDLFTLVEMIEDLSSARTLDLTWTETGGPPVAIPPRRGFGSRLIEQGIARELGGRAKLTFAPEGLRFRLLAPLSTRLSLG